MTAEIPDVFTPRPRVEGDREQEILSAAFDVLGKVGYDRLTMDAVATAARASKATLYRRWTNKSTLVIDALLAAKNMPPIPDTGSLRKDLQEFACTALMDPTALTIMASVLTAVHRDADFANDFRERFIGPKIRAMHGIYERARERGELRDDLDIDLFAPTLPGIVMHRTYVLGDPPDEEQLLRIIDQIILRAACR